MTTGNQLRLARSIAVLNEERERAKADCETYRKLALQLARHASHLPNCGFVLGNTCSCGIINLLKHPFLYFK